jgi:hypothetical protein
MTIVESYPAPAEKATAMSTPTVVRTTRMPSMSRMASARSAPRVRPYSRWAIALRPPSVSTATSPTTETTVMYRPKSTIPR